MSSRRLALRPARPSRPTLSSAYLVGTARRCRYIDAGEETSYDAGNRCPDAALDAAPQTDIGTREFYCPRDPAFTERDPAEEEALLCKALSAHLANRADLFPTAQKRRTVVNEARTPNRRGLPD